MAIFFNLGIIKTIVLRQTDRERQRKTEKDRERQRKTDVQTGTDR